LALQDKLISRRHAFIQAVAGQVFVFDLNSRTQIYWDGEDASRSQGWLDEGRSIKIGPYRIRRRGTSHVPSHGGESCAIASPDQDTPADSESLPRAALELPIRTANAPSLWPVIGRIALAGRSEPCHLVVTDETVSRFHAALIRTPLGIWVVDLLAREGTHVNGERVRWAWLGEGDSLRIGSFSFIIRYESLPLPLCRREVPLASGALPAIRPGTQLAVPARPDDKNPGALVVRFPAQSPTGLKAAGSAAPVTLVPADGDAWEPAIPRAPSAMAMWQRQMQMMESFHNDMIMMVQMFFAMHREHLASARDELDRVEQLTRELSWLQAKLAATPDAQKPNAASVVDRNSRSGQPPHLADRKHREPRAVQNARGEAARRNEPKMPKPARRSSQSGRQDFAPKGPAAFGSDGISAVDDAQLHAQLSQRITELQRERQGYWEKIISKMNK
jgi:pSer/pThr/pTyr-binding forkhead associated (FHA) protein